MPAVTTAKLQQLLQRGEVWLGTENRLADNALLGTGFTVLDELIGGGWPRAALVEILSRSSQGLSLLVPVLARLSHQPAWLAWVNSPYLPYAPRLRALGIDTGKVLLLRKLAHEQALWAAEQVLRSGNCRVLMFWPGRLGSAQVRRLQLAAEAGDCLGVLFRPPSAASDSSVAALRLQVTAAEHSLAVHLLKRRGGWAGGCVQIRDV